MKRLPSRIIWLLGRPSGKIDLMNATGSFNPFFVAVVISVFVVNDLLKLFMMAIIVGQEALQPACIHFSDILQVKQLSQ